VFISDNFPCYTDAAAAFKKATKRSSIAAKGAKKGPSKGDGNDNQGYSLYIFEEFITDDTNRCYANNKTSKEGYQHNST